MAAPAALVTPTPMRLPRGPFAYGFTKHGVYVTGKPVRVLISPFKAEGATVQTIQHWVGHPELLSDAQIARTAALAWCAQKHAGTYGTEFNPATGRPAPRIAMAVKREMEAQGWTYKSPEERAAARRAFSARNRFIRRQRVEWYQWATRVEEMFPAMRDALREKVVAPPAVRHIPVSITTPPR